MGKNYKQILVIISHSQDFMNGVCTNVMDTLTSTKSYTLVFRAHGQACDTHKASKMAMAVEYM